MTNYNRRNIRRRKKPLSKEKVNNLTNSGKKIEMSKLIFWILSGMILVVLLFSMVLMWATKDTTALAYLIPGAFGAYGIAIGFYYDKSKKENITKIEGSLFNFEEPEEITKEQNIDDIFEDDSDLEEVKL